MFTFFALPPWLTLVCYTVITFGNAGLVAYMNLPVFHWEGHYRLQWWITMIALVTQTLVAFALPTLLLGTTSRVAALMLIVALIGAGATTVVALDKTFVRTPKVLVKLLAIVNWISLFGPPCLIA